MTVHGYKITSWTQTWEKIDGAWYRQARAVRLADGQARIVAVLEDDQADAA